MDGVDDILRLNTTRAGTVDRLSLVSLGADYVVTSVQDAQGNLKVIAWREHALSLLRGQWAPKSTTPVRLGSPDSFVPGVDGRDPHIAVGHEHIVITNNTKIGLFSKNGAGSDRW